MTDQIKNDSELDELAQDLADCAMDEVKEYGGDLQGLAEERVDGSPHIIYNHLAHGICQNCNTDAGEDRRAEIGDGGESLSYDQIAVQIAYCELLTRVQQRLTD